MNSELVTKLNEESVKVNVALQSLKHTIELVKTANVPFELFDKITTTVSTLDLVNNYFVKVKEDLTAKLAEETATAPVSDVVTTA